MGFERDIKRIFGLRTAPKPNPRNEKELETVLSENNDKTGLWHLGYPLLYSLSFFLTAPIWQLWRDKRVLHLPEKCCVCLAEPKYYLTAFESSNWSIWGRKKKPVLFRVPHCEKHGQSKEAQLVVGVTEITTNVIALTFAGRNKQFLEEVGALNLQGDVFPPWEAFPELSAVKVGGWNQGNEEYWFNTIWRPFWGSLSKRERLDYFDRWGAHDNWKEYLETL